MFGQERGLSRFSVDFFCLTVPKNSAVESFTVALFCGIEKAWISEGEHHDFPSNFLSYSAETIRRGNL